MVLNDDWRTVQPWARWLFRVAVTVETAAALAQAVFAGGFLSGHYDLLELHKTNATVTGVAAVVMILVAVLVWRPAGGPWWPALVSAGLFGVEALQIVLGYGRTLAVHIPLGVAIITALVLLSVWAWHPAYGTGAATRSEVDLRPAGSAAHADVGRV